MPCATVRKIIPFAEHNYKVAVPAVAFELDIEKVHVEETLLVDPNKSYIDPDKWHPIIMSFRQLYSLGIHIHPLILAKGSDSQYTPWKQWWARKRLYKVVPMYKDVVGHIHNQKISVAIEYLVDRHLNQPSLGEGISRWGEWISFTACFFRVGRSIA